MSVVGWLVGGQAVALNELLSPKARSQGLVLGC